MLWEYAQRRCNPLSSICQCHCCKRETDVLHCRFTLDSPVFSLLSLLLAIHQPVSHSLHLTCCCNNSSFSLLAYLFHCLLFTLTLSPTLYSVFYLFFPHLQPCVAVLRGTLCCPQPLSAVLRVLLLWLRLFLSFSTTTTLYYPLLPTSWQVHTLCTTCLPACLPASACRFNLWLYVCQRLKLDACYRLFFLSFCCYLPFLTCDRDDQCNSKIFSQSCAMVLSTLLDILHVTNGSWHIVRTLLPCHHTVITDICPVPEHWCFNINSYIWILLNEGIKYCAVDTKDCHFDSVLQTSLTVVFNVNLNCFTGRRREFVCLFLLFTCVHETWPTC